MYQKSPEVTEKYLFGTNIFGKNAFGEFLEKCDSIFLPKSNLLNIQTIEEIGKVLGILGKIDPKKRDQFIDLLDVVEQKYHIKKSRIEQIIFKGALETIIDSEKEMNVKQKRIKL